MVSWEMQIIQMEQLVLMKSNMRTQDVHAHKHKQIRDICQEYICVRVQTVKGYSTLNENALLSLSAKTAQSEVTEQSKACNVFCEHNSLCCYRITTNEEPHSSECPVVT